MAGADNERNIEVYNQYKKAYHAELLRDVSKRSAKKGSPLGVLKHGELSPLAMAASAASSRNPDKRKPKRKPNSACEPQKKRNRTAKGKPNNVVEAGSWTTCVV